MRPLLLACLFAATLQAVPPARPSDCPRIDPQLCDPPPVPWPKDPEEPHGPGAFAAD